MNWNSTMSERLRKYLPSRRADLAYLRLTLLRMRWFIARRLHIWRILQLDNIVRSCASEPEFMKEAVASCSGTYVDVGAGAGSYVKLAKNAAHLICFEPDPRCVKVLRRNFPGARVYQVALSDRRGYAGMFFTKEILHNSLVMPTGQHICTRQVETRTLNDYEYELDNTDVVVKIDTEGAEHLVLQGGNLFIARHHPTLLIEYHNNLKQIYHSLKKYKYRITHLKQNTAANFDHGWLRAEHENSENLVLL